MSYFIEKEEKAQRLKLSCVNIKSYIVHIFIVNIFANTPKKVVLKCWGRVKDVHVMWFACKPQA